MRWGGRSLLWLQVQTLPPVVIWWPMHHVHKYYCRAVKETYSIYSITQNTTFNSLVFVFQSAAAAPSPVMGNMPPNDAMPGGPMPPGFFQVWFTLCHHPVHSSIYSSLRIHSYLSTSVCWSSISDTSNTNRIYSRQYLHVPCILPSAQGKAVLHLKQSISR